MPDRVARRSRTRLFSLLLPLIVVVGTSILPGCGTDHPASVQESATQEVAYDPTSAPLGLALAPIPGLTTGWHVLVPAPKQPGEIGPTPRRTRIASNSEDAPVAVNLPIPRGVPVVLSCRGFGDGDVTWSGVDGILPMSRGSAAMCRTVGTESMIITAQVNNPDGARSFTVRLKVIDVAIERIAVTRIVIAPPSSILREGTSNFETMGAFFGESIAEVKEIAPGKYRTGVDKPLEFVLQVEPPEMARLMEWRIDGRMPLLNDTVVRSFHTPGVHRISVGPPLHSREISVETFGVVITSPAIGELIPDGQPMTFTAQTVPPGFESEIVWLSSTKTGTASPTLGRGPEFTAEFRNTRSLTTGFQWLGVKANEEVIDQDTKGPDLLDQLHRQKQELEHLEQSLNDASLLPGVSQASLDRIVAALDQILDLKGRINDAIAGYAGLTPAEVAVIRAALDVAMPIINDLMDGLRGLSDDLDEAIDLVDHEYVGDTIELIGESVSAAGDWFNDAGQAVRDNVPTAIGDALGQAVQVVGTGLNVLGGLFELLGNPWPFSPQPPRD